MNCHENKTPVTEADVADEASLSSEPELKATGKTAQAFICDKRIKSDPDEIKDWQHLAASIDERIKRYPALRTVTQRTVYRWENLVRDETYTHIATGVHGYESLCCSEMLAEKVESAYILAAGKVTCPLCRIIWQDCQAFTNEDFLVEK